jgi:hypothetical protein
VDESQSQSQSRCGGEERKYLLLPYLELIPIVQFVSPVTVLIQLTWLSNGCLYDFLFPEEKNLWKTKLCVIHSHNLTGDLKEYFEVGTVQTYICI